MQPYPYEQEPPPRPRSRGPLLFGLFFFAAAAGLGYYAYHLRMDGERQATELRQRTDALTRLQKEHTADQARLTELARLSGVEKELSEAKAALSASQARLHDLEGEHAAVEAQMAEFREVTEKFGKLIDAGTLDVTFRRGRMIVGLPASVLFDSGSAELSADGQKAVAEVAKVLAGVRDRRFMVGGHTDNVPAVKEYKSNWALSAARAVTVLEALGRAGMSPVRLAAVGYAEFDPIASNASAEGRQKNRRIEIVLEPYLVAPPAEGAPGKKP